MDCETCQLKNVRASLTGKVVCSGNLLRPKTKQAFKNAVKNSGYAGICRLSPFRAQPYGEKSVVQGWKLGSLILPPRT